MDYLVLPSIVFVVIALLHATDPADINIYVAAWRRWRGRRP